jgi:hypothetical protein
MSEDDVGIPDSDPQHIDPAGDLAALVESGKFDLELSEDQDPEDLREFIKSVENSDDPTDPGTNATARMARAILEQTDRETSSSE